MLVLRLLFVAVCAIIIAFLAVAVTRSMRRLDRRIEEFRAEQEANPGPPPNPWLALAELYAEDERKNKRMKEKG